MIRQLAHLCFFTDQIVSMVNFYQNGLGLPVRFTLNDDDGNLMGYYLDCGNSSFVEIFNQSLAVKQWGGQVQAMVSGSQFRHLCFEVTGLEGYIKTLEGRGIKVGGITTGMDMSRQAWTADPDGNAIELMEYTNLSLQLHPNRGASGTVRIRRERPEDIPIIHQINVAAFKSEGEANLVDRLRAHGAGLLSLVAVLDGQVVGNIYFSPMTITDEDGHITEAVGLAPLAVLPDFQNQGIGSQLASAGLDKLRDMGHKLVIVLGQASYYPRFGFKPTLPYGIRWESEVDEAHFMITELQPGALAGVHGVARYLPEFKAL
jgi:predicted N-acetyltransferase YhbS/catechol 2,3-dioxygenase-like lactoylglutathione lyase family enzyme